MILAWASPFKVSRLVQKLRIFRRDRNLFILLAP